MRRRIVGQNGELKQILKCGECKSVSTERVTLTPGQREEVETIQLAFDLYTKRHKTRHQIAQILNQRKCFWGKRPWNIVKVNHLLRNPVYKGAYAYAKHRDGRDLSPDRWQIREHSFPAIIADRQWLRANELVREETRSLMDSEMLEGLHRLWKRQGRLNSQLINATKDIPSVMSYQKHFGSLNEAYKRIGYPLPRDYVYEHIASVIKKLRDGLCEEIRAQIRGVNGNAELTPGRGELLVNENVGLRVKCTTGRLWRGKEHYGQMLWRLSFLGRRTEDILIIARLLPPQQSIMDYFVVPAFSQFCGVMYSKRENNPPLMQLYCFPKLQPLIEAFRRYSVEVED
jgi:hypothetical protein